MTDLKAFTDFLEKVPLERYRKKYQPVKLVEMDLPRDVQAIKSLYSVYWEKKDFIRFPAFYKRYEKSQKREIEDFRKKITMCSDCFYRGLPARTYRTWASLITQIHAGYVAESVFGKGKVQMSAELDHKGADFQVRYKESTLNYQVKKRSFSREVRTAKKTKRKIDGDFIDILYHVPNFEKIKTPMRKDGKGYYKEYKDFKKEFLDTKLLKVLDNGFVVFTKTHFQNKKREIDN